MASRPLSSITRTPRSTHGGEGNSTIQNTPISISALSGDQLTAAGLTRIEDIAREVPGLSTRSAGPGFTEYEARGLASNGGGGNYSGNLMLNLPLGNTLALRVVLSDPYRSGWIDNKTVSPLPINFPSAVTRHA